MWIVVVIIGREFLISGLRSIASSEGFTVYGQRIGQAEDGGADRVGGFGNSGAPLGPLADRRGGQVPVNWYAVAAIYFTVVVATISAVDYFIGFWKKIDHASKDRRKAAVLSRGKSVRIS